MSLWTRIANVFRRPDADIDAELQTHLDEARSLGRPLGNFGSPLRTREEVRDAVVAVRLESLVADAVFGWRQLWKHKAASAAAIISLGLGIGGCTAAFRLIDALFLRPLPIADPSHVYALSFAEPGGPAIEYFDYPGFRRLRESVAGRAELIAASSFRTDLTFGSAAEIERANQQYVSGWMFGEFGLKPALGRLLSESDDANPRYAVLSYDYWSRRFGRDPAVLGREFRTGQDVFQIVGVGPEGFTGTEPGTVTDVFVPVTVSGNVNATNIVWLRVWARMRAEASPAQVQTLLQTALRAHRQEQVKSWPAGPTLQQIQNYLMPQLSLVSAAAGRSQTQQTYRRALAVLAVLVALVLLIACANVANLMTAQAAARAREMALRVSLGAGRGRLIQLVLLESAWIAIAASAVGLLFAGWAAPLVVAAINPPDQPVRLALDGNWRVSLFAAAVTFAAALLSGIVPALHASSVKPSPVLKGDLKRNRRRLAAALLAAQVAFCCLVTGAAGLFVSSFQRMAAQPLGFSSAQVVTLESHSNTAQRTEFWYQAAAHLRELPEVESAALSGVPLMGGYHVSERVWVDGVSSPALVNPWLLDVSPGWFETMRIALVDGRDFAPADTHPSVVIVNRTFARTYFGGQNPVGRTFEFYAQSKNRAQVRIVGEVEDARYNGLRGPIPPIVYVPFRKAGDRNRSDWGTFAVRSRSADPMSLAPLLRREVPAGRPEIHVSTAVSQEERVRSQTIRERMLATLSMFFGGVALILAGVGVAGVLHYAVLERRRELGIRIALGAGRRRIALGVVLGAFAMVGAGSAVGLILGLATQRYISTLLYQTKATDASMLALPLVAIFTAALLAALAPVMRALRIDPAQLLRSE